MINFKAWYNIKRTQLKTFYKSLKPKIPLFITKIKNTTFISVKHNIYKYIHGSQFARNVRLQRDMVFEEPDWRHTTATTLEWVINWTMTYTLQFYFYITKPLSIIIKYINSNIILRSLVLTAIILYFAHNFLQNIFIYLLNFSFLKHFFVESFMSLFIITSIIVFFFLLKQENIQQIINFYLKEAKFIQMFIGILFWGVILRFSITQAYNHYLDINAKMSVIHFIFFPIVTLLLIALFISALKKINYMRKQPLNLENVSKFEKIMYINKVEHPIKAVFYFILWGIALYITTFYLHSYFYTYILSSTGGTAYNALMFYSWTFLVCIFLTPRLLKYFIEIGALLTVRSKYESVKYLTFFTLLLYITVHYVHKFYYFTFYFNTLSFNFLTFVIFILLIFTIILFTFIPSAFTNIFKTISFAITSLIYFLSLFYWINFDRSTPKFQYIIELCSQKLLGLDIIFGIDGISLFFILLTTLISPLLILIVWDLNKNTKLLSIVLLLTELLTLLTFMALDLFIFYVAFESILIPLFISILIWGSRRRKIKAAKMLFIYTLISSILFLIALFTFYVELGSTNFFSLLLYSNQALSLNKQYFLWCLLFIAFAIKVPLYPLHTWLPEAHVEAPTFGSVILASLLLKTGGYGIFRFVLPFFPEANIFFSPLVFMLALLGVIYGALASIRQIDMKRIIAYLSVSHMNLCVLGQFSETLEGLIGSLLLMAAHGLIAAGFFISVGFLYERYHSRLIYYYGGLARYMPIFATNLFIFVLANMNMPGTSNFVGELLILISVGYKGFILCLLAAIGSAIGALCTIWFWNRLMFGEIKLNYLGKFEDINRREVAIFMPLTIFNFAIGIFTNEFVDTCYNSIYFLYTFLLI
jgi:proton-translocating NADH-quinone oxidoreductase chain M